MSEIITAQDLQDAAALSRRCHSTEEPLYVTRDGHTDLVVMSVESYEHLLVMNEVNSKLATAEVQIRNAMGRPLAQFLQRPAREDAPYRVCITPAAEDDLCSTRTYLERVLHDPAQAQVFTDALDALLDQLEQAPQRHPLCREGELRTRGYRRVNLQGDVILFQTDEAQKTVWLARIFHGSQNYEAYL